MWSQQRGASKTGRNPAQRAAPLAHPADRKSSQSYDADFPALGGGGGGQRGQRQLRPVATTTADRPFLGGQGRGVVNQAMLDQLKEPG